MHGCIFGAKRKKETWRKRYSYKLYETFKESNIVNYIKVKRLAWAGHLMRMNNNENVNQSLYSPGQALRVPGC